MRLAIIGMGMMGFKYAKMVLEEDLGFELVASTRVKEDKLNLIKDKLPDDFKIYESDKDLFLAYDEGLIDFDCVFVVTPHYAHEYAVKEALKRNIHVLCDKPAGVTLKSGREMLNCMKDSKYAFVFHQRTYPIYEELYNIISNKKYGEVKRFSYIVTDWYRVNDYYNSASWRAKYKTDGGGTIINQCPHSIDILYHLFKMPDSITAFISNGKYHPIEVEDEATVYLKWNSGLNGIFVASTGELPGINRLEISCDKAVITAYKDYIEIKEIPQSESYYRNMKNDEFIAPDETIKKIEFINDNKKAYKNIITNFYNAIVNNEEVIASGKEALYSLYICNAIYLSSWTNKSINIYDINSKEELNFEEEFINELEKRK